jgi:hypothetical protein
MAPLFLESRLNIISEFTQKLPLMGRSLHRASVSLSVSNGDPASLAVQPLLQFFCHPGWCIGLVNPGQNLMPHHAAFSFVFCATSMFIKKQSLIRLSASPSLFLLNLSCFNLQFRQHLKGNELRSRQARIRRFQSQLLLALLRPIYHY